VHNEIQSDSVPEGNDLPSLSLTTLLGQPQTGHDVADKEVSIATTEG
jgi:hypothetical protein